MLSARYSDRLKRLRPAVLDQARAHWLKHYDGPAVVQDKVLNTIAGHLCILSGAIVKILAKKPDIVAEYIKSRSIAPLPSRETYLSEDDTLFLEDETGRTKLVLSTEEVLNKISGSVAAVIGRGLPTGEFQVEKMFFPGMPPQMKILELEENEQEDDLYVGFVSGLNFGRDDVNPLLTQLLFDYVTGHVGGSGLHSQQARISRLVLVGDTVFSGTGTSTAAGVCAQVAIRTLTL